MKKEIAVNYSKVLFFLGVGCLVGFLFVFGVDQQWGNLAKMETFDANLKASEPQLKLDVEEYQKLKHVPKRESDGVKPNDNSAFYHIIVNNNLFRPLGWKPPKEEPEYRLLGTAIGVNSEAFVVENRSNQFYVVSVGDEIGDARIKEIEEKRITLDKNGETITLNTGGMEFLKTDGSSSRNVSSSQYNSNNETEKSNQRGTRSKSADLEAIKKRYAKITKQSEKQMKSTMKEVAKIEKDMDKAEYKALIEKKKVIATDLKLKRQSSDK